MKKNIMITILSFLLILFVFYGFIKAKEAERNLIVAEEQHALAMQNAEEALVTSEYAITKAAEVEKIYATLEECESRKP